MTKRVAKAYYGTYGHQVTKRMGGLDFKVKYRTESKKEAEREAKRFRDLGCKARILTSPRNKKIHLVYVHCGKAKDNDL